jgi:PAS domain-containing protein
MPSGVKLPDESSPAIICEARPPFAIVHANVAWENLCGWSSSHMQGTALDQSRPHMNHVCLIVCLMVTLRWMCGQAETLPAFRAQLQIGQPSHISWRA